MEKRSVNEKNGNLLHHRLTEGLSEPQAIHDYYLKIISCMPNNVYWLDRNCVTQGCNENVLKLVGLRSLDQFVGITYEEMGRLAGWTEGQAESFKRDDMEVMATGVAKINVEEPPLYDALGNPVYYMSSRMPIFNEKKEVIGVIGISVDITERKKNEQALKVALQDANAASLAKTAFLENISHDVKIPLTGIIGSAEYLKIMAKDMQLKSRADNIYKSGLRFLDIIDELIEVSRLGLEPVSKKRFKLKEVVNSLVELLKPSIENTLLALKVKYDDRIPTYLIGNQTYLSRILLNLLSNAIKFTQQGDIRLEVQKEEGEKTNKREVVIKIDIQDTGIGIPKDKIPEIFEKFTRLAPAYEGKYEGRGLGLHVVKEFIEAMEGEIYVKSEVGKGSQFTVFVPLKVALSQSDDNNLEGAGLSEGHQIKTISSIPKPSNEVEIAQKSFHKSTTNSVIKLKVLLVEDEIIAAHVAKDVLQLCDCEVDVANSGESALKLFESNKYDLIFMDVGLPGISGIDVAKKIREAEEHADKKTPIIALSAHIDPESCLAVGMNKVLTKPLLKPKAEKIVEEQRSLLLKHKEKLAENELKIIDLELCVSLSDSTHEDAKKETLKLFIEAVLPNERQEIEQANGAKNIQRLTSAVHKMHGSLAYCGVPRLKNAVKNLETTLRSTDHSQLDKIYNNFCSELIAFIEAYKNL